MILVLGSLAAGLVAISLFALVTGPSQIGLDEVLGLLFRGAGDATVRDIVLGVRLPRVVLGVLVGAETPFRPESLLSVRSTEWTNAAATGWGGDAYRVSADLRAGERIVVVQDGESLGDWPLELLPDLPPDIELARQHAEAEEILRYVAHQTIAPTYSDDALWQLYLVYKAQGKTAPAKAVLHELIQRFPKTKHGKRAIKALAGEGG